MKVIKKGEIPPTPPIWWIGREITCFHCGTVMELEAQDQGKVRTETERHPMSPTKLSVPCPICESINVREYSAEESKPHIKFPKSPRY